MKIKEILFEIHGERTGSAQVFSHEQFNLSKRIRTATSVQWPDLPRWKRIRELHRTPDLASIIQEIVEQSDWNTGNTIVFLIEEEGKRNAVNYNLQPAAAPRLVVQYQLYNTNDHSLHLDQPASHQIRCLPS